MNAKSCPSFGLGGFHLLMSVLGSVGNLMKGSGLDELFEEVFAPNTIPMMMSGKQTARAVRAHIMAHSALMSVLTDNLDESD